MNAYNFKKNIRIIKNSRNITCDTKITNTANVLQLMNVFFCYR